MFFMTERQVREEQESQQLANRLFQNGLLVGAASNRTQRKLKAELGFVNLLEIPTPEVSSSHTDRNEHEASIKRTR